MKPLAIVKALLEMDDSNLKSFAMDAIKEKRKRLRVPARIIADETGRSVDFDARRGLDHLNDKWIEWLRKEEFKTCEPADRVADYGGAAVNNLQEIGPYEVYIDAEAAEAYIPYRQRKALERPEQLGEMPE